MLAREADLQVIGEADDGQDTLQQVRRLQPNLLIMEALLPGLNGLAVLNRIQRASPHTRVIFYTVYSDEAFVVEAFNNGAIGYVLKKSSPENLLQAIRSARANRQFLCPAISQRSLAIHRNKGQQTPFDSYNSLSPREREVLQLAVEGHSASEIGQRLHISPRTVEMHRSNLMRKLGLKRPIDLIRYAMRRGIAPME